jgi:hypothetical protein
MRQFLVLTATGAEKIYIGTSIQELEALFNVRVLAVLSDIH